MGQPVGLHVDRPACLAGRVQDRTKAYDAAATESAELFRKYFATYVPGATPKVRAVGPIG